MDQAVVTWRERGGVLNEAGAFALQSHAKMTIYVCTYSAFYSQAGLISRLSVVKSKEDTLQLVTILAPQFLEMGRQRATEPKVGQRDAKNFWSSLSKQTRKKHKNLKWNYCVRHEIHEDAADL